MCMHFFIWNIDLLEMAFWKRSRNHIVAVQSVAGDGFVPECSCKYCMGYYPIQDFSTPIPTVSFREAGLTEAGGVGVGGCGVYFPVFSFPPEVWLLIASSTPKLLKSGLK